MITLWYAGRGASYDTAVHGGTYTSWHQLLAIVPFDLTSHPWHIRPNINPNHVTVTIRNVNLSVSR